MHERGALLCPACTGLLVLAQTGLLDGRHATTHWTFAPICKQHFPKVKLRIDDVLVIEGEREELIMAGGAASWQDLALYLIARFVGPAVSRTIARYELIERHADGQSPYLPFSPSIRHGDSLVLGLQQWLDDHFTVATPVAEMTRRSALSPRAFERRFRRATGFSPLRYIQHMRIEEAKRRLEQTDLPIHEISWQVGYEDAAAFRRLFKRIAQVTPGPTAGNSALPSWLRFAGAGPGQSTTCRVGAARCGAHGPRFSIVAQRVAGNAVSVMSLIMFESQPAGDKRRSSTKPDGITTSWSMRCAYAPCALCTKG